MSQYDEYYALLLKCQPMDLWQLKRLQDNIEFLTENTKNLMTILQELLYRKIITQNEAQLIVRKIPIHFLKIPQKKRKHSFNKNIFCIFCSVLIFPDILRRACPRTLYASHGEE